MASSASSRSSSIISNWYSARIDGEADRRAAEPQRIGDAAGDRLVLGGGQAVAAVHLQDGRDGAGIGGGAGLDHAERRGIGVQPGLDRQLEMVVRVIGGGVGREAAGRAVLEALVDRQDHQRPVPPSFPSIRMRARLPLVPGLSLSYQERISLTLRAASWGPLSRLLTGGRRHVARGDGTVTRPGAAIPRACSTAPDFRRSSRPRSSAAGRAGRISAAAGRRRACHRGEGRAARVQHQQPQPGPQRRQRRPGRIGAIERRRAARPDGRAAARRRSPGTSPGRGCPPPPAPKAAARRAGRPGRAPRRLPPPMHDHRRHRARLDVRPPHWLPF